MYKDADIGDMVQTAIGKRYKIAQVNGIYIAENLDTAGVEYVSPNNVLELLLNINKQEVVVSIIPKKEII